MRRRKLDGADNAAGPVASFLLGTLIFLTLVGCSGSAQPTSESEPVAETASVAAPALTPTAVAVLLATNKSVPLLLVANTPPLNNPR